MIGRGPPLPQDRDLQPSKMVQTHPLPGCNENVAGYPTDKARMRESVQAMSITRRHGDSAPLWPQAFQRLPAVTSCQQAPPLQSTGICIYGPCKCSSVYISCSKPRLGIMPPETKDLDEISRLLAYDALFGLLGPPPTLLVLGSSPKPCYESKGRGWRMPCTKIHIIRWLISSKCRTSFFPPPVSIQSYRSYVAA